MKNKSPVITIDGPSGTGKGTIAQLVAQKLGWHLLDSGALYRVLALAAAQHAVDNDNEEALKILAAHLDVQFEAGEPGQMAQVILEGHDVTEAIRTEECGNSASKVAALPSVREALLQRQREFQILPGLVTDGRDMGTVVFPEAALKIYLDASDDVRAKRRHKQLKEKGISVSLAQVLKDLQERDQRDKQRAVAPLKAAEGAIVVDTTDLTIDEVFRRIMEEARQCFL